MLSNRPAAALALALGALTASAKAGEDWPQRFTEKRFQLSCMFALGDSFGVWDIGSRRIVPKALFFKKRTDLDDYFAIWQSKTTYEEGKTAISAFIASGKMIVMSGSDELTAVGPIRGCSPGGYEGVVSHPVYGEGYLIIPGRF